MSVNKIGSIVQTMSEKMAAVTLAQLRDEWMDVRGVNCPKIGDNSYVKRSSMGYYRSRCVFYFRFRFFAVGSV